MERLQMDGLLRVCFPPYFFSGFVLGRNIRLFGLSQVQYGAKMKYCTIWRYAMMCQPPETTSFTLSYVHIHTYRHMDKYYAPNKSSIILLSACAVQPCTQRIKSG